MSDRNAADEAGEAALRAIVAALGEVTDQPHNCLDTAIRCLAFGAGFALEHPDLARQTYGALYLDPHQQREITLALNALRARWDREPTC